MNAHAYGPRNTFPLDYTWLKTHIFLNTNMCTVLAQNMLPAFAAVDRVTAPPPPYIRRFFSAHYFPPPHILNRFQPLIIKTALNKTACAYWFLYLIILCKFNLHITNLLRPSVRNIRSNIQKLHILSCMDLKTNSEIFPTEY